MNSVFSLFSKTNNKLFISAVLIINLAVLFSANLTAQETDTAAPDIVEFSFTPSTVNTTNGSQSVTVTIRAVDAGSGVSGLSVFFQANENTYQGVPLHLNSQHLVSGNSRDGVYKATAIFPQYSRAGAWKINSIFVFDGVNRKTFYSSELAARGFATDLQVVSNEDASAPEISQFSITPTAIDISRTAQILITVRVRDALSGVDSISVSFGRREDDYSYGTNLDSRHRISGDEKDGVYSIASRPFHYTTEEGTYYAHVSARDKIGNHSSLDTDKLVERGYSSQLEITRSEPLGFVFISGRVLTSDGRAISKAIVTLTDSFGVVRYATTNPFGYYRFDRVRTLRGYSVQARSKNREFPQQQIQLVDYARANLDFTAAPAVR